MTYECHDCKKHVSSVYGCSAKWRSTEEYVDSIHDGLPCPKKEATK
jgi:hypothetical protein